LLIQHGKTAGSPQEESLLNSLAELKKQDLFDLGVVLTICATDGLDMVNEDYVSQLKKMNKQCCLAHAVRNVYESNSQFDQSLKQTLVVMRRLLRRVSD
jgi:hypothetical protein